MPFVTPKLWQVAFAHLSFSLMLQTANNVKAAISLYYAGGSPNALNISCASSILLISVQYYFQFKKFVHNAVYIFH